MINTLFLARAQFATTATFHILFPTITIALCWCLLFFKLRYNSTRNESWMDLYRFWVKIFALAFALGVGTGVPMSFQFGKNWPGFMATVGNVAGPLLAYEVLGAFFLEATFLGIMLFGMKRVSNGVHTLATFLVAIGTTASAFWIIALNSWMQTPAGFEMIDGVAHATSWFDIILSPSMPYRLVHKLMASFLMCAFFIAGISAYKVLRKDNSDATRLGLKFGIYLAAIAMPLQVFVGDLHGLNTLHHQPAKVAAMEGLWNTESGAGLRLFAIVDNKNHENKMEITIPKASSVILTHSLDGEVKGINEFSDVPPVAQVFYSFRIMVGIGVLMLFVSFLGVYFIKKKKMPKYFLVILVAMTFSGWIAAIAGWYVTEIGRQPYIVYGVLKIADAVAHNVSPGMALSALIMYLTLYVVMLASFVSVVFYIASREIKTNK